MKTFKHLREEIESNKANESRALLHTTATDMDDNDRHITKLKDAGIFAQQGAGKHGHIILDKEHEEKAREILANHLKEDELGEGKRGLWDNIHAKRKRIKAGSGERMRKPGSKGAPTAAELKASQTEEVETLDEGPWFKTSYGWAGGSKPGGGKYKHPDTIKAEKAAKAKAQTFKDAAKKEGVAEGLDDNDTAKTAYMHGLKHGREGVGNNMGRAQAEWGNDFKHYNAGFLQGRNQKAKSLKAADQGVAEELTSEQQFDIIEEMVESLALEHGVDSETIWEDLESVSDEELLEVAAWQRKEGKNPSGGLNAKGVASYRRENPGSKLQTAVTTKPSKLKAGSKAANRRKSFCARMGGMKKRLTSAKTARDPDSRINKALRKWNC